MKKQVLWAAAIVVATFGLVVLLTEWVPSAQDPLPSGESDSAFSLANPEAGAYGSSEQTAPVGAQEEASTVDDRSNADAAVPKGTEFSEMSISSPQTGEAALDTSKAARDSSNDGGSASGRNDDLAAKKAEIDKQVEAQLISLRNECKAESEALLQEIIAALGDGGESSRDAIAGDYLQRVRSAEASCDARFADVVAEAAKHYEKAGLSPADMPDWESRYIREKESARASAFMRLAQALDGGNGEGANK